MARLQFGFTMPADQLDKTRRSTFVAELGRDPATIRRTWCGGCACAPTQAEAEAMAGDRFAPAGDEDFGFVGTPELVIEQMRPFVELGVDYFMLDCTGFPRLTTLEMLVAQVLPAWR